ncbi:MAG: ABC transporter permease [Halanaerobiales bacterium]
MRIETNKEKGLIKRISTNKKSLGDNVHYQIMLIPAIIFLIIFSIYPLINNIIAFKYFMPGRGIFGSPWAGWDHFKTVFMIPSFYRVLSNTVIIAVWKMALHLIIPLLFALMLNEVRTRWFKRSVQTIVYLPYFLSWVILAGIFKDVFSVEGIVNAFLGLFNIEPIMFFASNSWFRPLIITTDVWKNFGFNAIVYLAALTNISPNLYEAARIDGCSRLKQIWYITLPGLIPTIVLLGVLSLQNILNAGFDQIFNMYNVLVYETGDILDTYIYRMGLMDNQYEFATAVGLMKSAVAFIFIIIAHWLAKKFANYRIF